MASPFPGMDPYLENPETWSGFHGLFLAQVVEHLFRPLRPRYVLRYEERVYVTGEDDPAYRWIVPDVRVVVGDVTAPAQRPQQSGGGTLVIDEPVRLATLAEDEIRERYIQVIDPLDLAVVTVIELLSPTNKLNGSYGRESFLQKRREVLASPAHWIEIDLLRTGARTVHLPGVAQSDYVVYLSRAGSPRQRVAWPFGLKDRLPVIGVPLRGDDPDVPLDLQAVFAATIERGSYDINTPYRRPIRVPLAPDQQAWADALIANWAAEVASKYTPDE